MMYRDYATYLSERFPGCKVQKLTVNTGRSCPNRDGTIGRGGCIYCNNESFSPGFAKGDVPIAQQLEAGKQFFAGKYPQMRYLAYFQSYTSTHGSADELVQQVNEALGVDGIDGVIIGTRPDCVDARLLSQLGEINKSHRVIMEYGAESTHDSTLQLINRCHLWADTVNACEMTRTAGLDFGLHFIMGLPGESRSMMLQTIDRINDIKPDAVKFHQLQVIRGTRLASMLERGEIEVKLFDVDEYLDFCCEILQRLSPEIAIERFTSSAPPQLLVAPKWGVKNYEFVHRLKNRLQRK